MEEGDSDGGGVAFPLRIFVLVLLSLLVLGSGILLFLQVFSGTEEVTESAKGQVELEYNLEPGVANIGPVQQALVMPEAKDCREDFSCDGYFVFVPMGAWEHPRLFEVKAEERMEFFADISQFKFRKVGMIIVPLEFAANCSLGSFRSSVAADHLLIKKCADRYADRVGIEYEKAIGLGRDLSGGRAFFNSKVTYASLGFTGEGYEADTPSLVAHELGHTYNLCDEYGYQVYLQQTKVVNGCANAFPADCGKSGSCPGNTPTYRDYGGKSVLGVCGGEIHYSVMGPATGAECGYDATGGYEEVGGRQ